jgi:hypothetical protein
MKITIESTTRVVDIEINGTKVPARIWEGKTESGIPVTCAITRVAVHQDQNQEQFRRELAECKAPSAEAIEAIPLRMII